MKRELAPALGFSVIPAQAGIQRFFVEPHWIPACAGMTQWYAELSR